MSQAQIIQGKATVDLRPLIDAIFFAARLAGEQDTSLELADELLCDPDGNITLRVESTEKYKNPYSNLDGVRIYNLDMWSQVQLAKLYMRINPQSGFAGWASSLGKIRGVRNYGVYDDRTDGPQTKRLIDALEKSQVMRRKNKYLEDSINVLMAFLATDEMYEAVCTALKNSGEEDILAEVKRKWRMQKAARQDVERYVAENLPVQKVEAEVEPATQVEEQYEKQIALLEEMVETQAKTIQHMQRQLELLTKQQGGSKPADGSVADAIVDGTPSDPSATEEASGNPCYISKQTVCGDSEAAAEAPNPQPVEPTATSTVEPAQSAQQQPNAQPQQGQTGKQNGKHQSRRKAYSAGEGNQPSLNGLTNS